MRKSARSRRSITRAGSRLGTEVEKLERRFAMAANCGCGAAVDPVVTQNETEPAAIVATPEVAALRSSDVRLGATVDTSRLSGLAGVGGAARRGWVASSVTPAMSRNVHRQATGLWRAGAYVGGRTFRDPFARPGDCTGGPCQAANSISFRLGPDLEGRPNVITNLRIQFLATLRKPDGTREGRTVFFSDDPGDLSVDEFDATPPLQLESRRGVQTLRFQVRDAGAGENLYTVELKLTWNNRTKTFVASMKAATEVVEGRFYSARTYPGSRPGVILAAGPPRVIYDGGVAVGASGAVRRTGD